MSEVLDNTSLVSQFGEKLPPAIREEYVKQLIVTLHEVAEGEYKESFTPLPLLLKDNVDLAYILTDAKASSTINTPSGRKIIYHKGQFSGESLEFATRFEEGEDQPSAWGVRRTYLEARRNPHQPAIVLPKAAMDVFVKDVLEDIEEVEITTTPYRMAA